MKTGKALVALMALLTASSLCACGAGGNASSAAPSASSAAPAASSAAASSEAASSQEAAGVAYPIPEGGKLTIAMTEEAQVTANAATLGDTPFAKELMAQTGLELEYKHPAGKDGMNLLFASGDYPDIIACYPFFTDYAGGPVKAIKDNVIVPVNDLMAYMPDLQAVFDGNELYRKSCITPTGEIIGAPMIRNGEELLTSAGLIIRQDWLDDLGLDTPETPEEVASVLREFRDKKGATVPFSFTLTQLRSFGLGTTGGSCLTSPFGLPTVGFYQHEGKVYNGFYQPEYKDVLAWLHSLYAEGLLDPNFATIEDSVQSSNIMNGQSGITIGRLNGGVGGYLQTMADKDPAFNVIGFGPLVANKGDVPLTTHYSNPVNGYFNVITSSCKNQELAAMFLNYPYTEKGHLLYNFGIEGVSYTMENGQPTYTELITKNPDGLNMQYALAQYTRSWSGDGMLQDPLYIIQYSPFPQQKETLKRWTNSTAKDYKMPLVSVADEYANEYSALISDINTYTDEMTIRFITGQESLDNFEGTYLATLKSMNIERAIELQQMALDEFNAR